MSSYSKWWIVILLFFLPAVLFSQGTDTTKIIDKILGKLSLSQSVLNVKDNGEAAFVTLVYPKDSASSQNFSFAIAYNVFPEHMRASLKPFFEWQKNTLADKKQDLIASGLSYQTFLRDYSKVKWTPYIIASANYKNDKVKVTEGFQANAYFSPVFNSGPPGKFYPEPDAVNVFKWLIFYYDVYAGGEYENRMKVKTDMQKGEAWRWYFRVTGSFYPLPSLLDKRFEVIADFVYRNAFVNTSDAETRINTLFKISFNVLLFTKEKGAFADVKIGFDHQKGADPTTGFDKQRINTLSIKVKI